MKQSFINRYFREQRYLPSFMRDFHDQKDLFIAIQQSMSKQRISWVDAHIYTIDIFLRFMAVHGYTLQKARNPELRGHDIENTIREKKEERDKAFSSVLGLTPTNTHNS